MAFLLTLSPCVYNTYTIIHKKINDHCMRTNNDRLFHDDI